MNKIVIVDYGAGNIDSIFKAVKYCGGDVVVSSKADAIENASHIILPGVGTFDNAYNCLKATGLIPVIKEQVVSYNLPLLGICVGMQLLATYGEEGDGSEGLNLIPGIVKKMIPFNEFKVPHVGWNEIAFKNKSALSKGISNNSNFYFVHSYMFHCTDNNDLIATADYLNDGVTAIIQKGNVFGVQFHPEKSQKNGAKLLKNFIEL